MASLGYLNMGWSDGGDDIRAIDQHCPCQGEPMIIRTGGLDDPQIIALLRVHAHGMLDNSPPEATHFLDLSALKGDDILFLSAWDGDQLCGIGALKDLGDQSGEVKSMRTAANALNRGVGSRILAKIIGVARARGYQKLLLETGTGTAFDAAQRLYTRHGFAPCPAFGSYSEGPFNRFFALYL